LRFTTFPYLLDAVCPERGTGSGLVLPVCNQQAMQFHLGAIAPQVARGAHAILLLDARWHREADRKVFDVIRVLLVGLPGVRSDVRSPSP
jgi:hypothetical protein